MPPSSRAAATGRCPMHACRWQRGPAAGCEECVEWWGRGGKAAGDEGKEAGDCLAAAWPELNASERAAAEASAACMVDAGWEKQKELTKEQLDNGREVA